MSLTTQDLVLNEGSVAVKVEGIRASQTVEVINNTFDGAEEVIVNGVTLTEGVDWDEQGSITLTAQDIADAVTASTDPLIKGLIKVRSVVVGVVTLEAVNEGEAGNLFTLAEGNPGATDNLTIGGALFTLGAFCQGVYTPEEEGEDFIAPLEDGLEFSPGRELLERAVRTSTTESEPSRVGIKSSTGTLPIELKASSTEGEVPEFEALMLALLGGKRRSVNSITTETGHTSTVINIATADILKIKLGDTIKLKKNGLLDQDHVSAVLSVDTSAETITLRVAAIDLAGDTLVVPDGTVIAPFTTYFVDSALAPSLSVTNYIGGKIREKITGIRPTAMDVNNFTTGQIGDMSFGLEGIDLKKEVGAPLFTPIFDDSVPPVMLDAKVFQDAGEILVNTFALNFANTVAFKTATGSLTGRIASRITDFALTGSIDPYTEDDNVSRFNTFDLNSAFTLFASTHNPTAVVGEKEEVIAFYMPNGRITEFATGDQEGLATDAMNFSGHRTNGNDTVFVTFI